MLWVLKRTVSMRLEHPKHMFQLMDKEIIAILRWKTQLGPMCPAYAQINNIAYM